jgi:hypothetical protein
MQHILIYIDPGSGSYLVQAIVAAAIVAAALGVAFFFKNIVTYIKHWYYRIFKKN